jgi:CRISPR-associated protein Cas2
MSFSEAHLYLICYDIADPRRLQRVHAFLRRHAMPVQYSVFLARLTERRLLNLLADLARRIDPRSDDVRAYPIPHEAEAVTMGRQYLPPGVVLADPLIGVVLDSAAPDEPENHAAECDNREDQPEN